MTGMGLHELPFLMRLTRKMQENFYKFNNQTFSSFIAPVQMKYPRFV